MPSIEMDGIWAHGEQTGSVALANRDQDFPGEERLPLRLDGFVCDLDFAKKYGPIADSLVDVHHTKPVHTLKPGDKTSHKDLVLLCANCQGGLLLEHLVCQCRFLRHAHSAHGFDGLGEVGC
jgi:hypothetical protein